MPIRRSALWSDPRVKPPFGAAEIDWGHPLATGILLRTNHAEGGGQKFVNDAGGPASGTLGTNYQWNAGPSGLALACTAAGASPGTVVTFGAETAIPVPTNGTFTVALHYRKTDSTNRSSSGFGVADPSYPYRFHAHLPDSDGTVYFDYRGTNIPLNRVTAAGLTFGNDIWIFSGGSELRIYQNGILRGNSGTPNETRSASAADLVLFGGTSNTDLAESAWFSLYQRELSAAEALWLSTEPYAMFRPIVRRRYFAPTTAVSSRSGQGLLTLGIGY